MINLKKGAIKVSIFNPVGEESPFNMDYYLNKHIPTVLELYGDGVIVSKY
jgi:hypothetical protein